MHSWGQRLLAHMSPFDSTALLFQQWDTQAASPWSSHQTPPSTNFQVDLAEGRSLAASKQRWTVSLEFQKVWKEWEVTLNINKERGACRQRAKYFICTCQYFYYAVMSELFITVFTTWSLFIGHNVSEFTWIRWVNACLNIKSITFPLIIFVMALKVSILSAIIPQHIYILLISLYKAACFVAFGSIIALQMSCVKHVKWTLPAAAFIAARKGFCAEGRSRN